MVRVASDAHDTVEALREPIEAIQPMAVGGLATVLVTRNLAGDASHALRTVEHGLLVYFLLDLALALAADGTAAGALRWVEAFVLVPYAAILGVGMLPVLTCGTGVAAGLRAVLYDLHGGVALCRGLVAVDLVAGAGFVALVAEYLPEGPSSPGN